jgi:serine/threonine protein kinase
MTFAEITSLIPGKLNRHGRNVACALWGKGPATRGRARAQPAPRHLAEWHMAAKGLTSDSPPDDRTADRLRPGSVIAGYRLEDEIGRGGMAVVFHASDERLGRQVALKVLAPALAADAAFRRKFVRESRAAAVVDDPHIVPIFEAGQSGGALFIAMKLVSGGDVRTLVRRHGPLSAPRAAAIVSPVASALDAAHATGLVHRDVKPANMLLDVRAGRPDHVYLSDFGPSKRAESPGLTSAGILVGTPHYMAPEQIAGGRVDGRADQYSLACATFELLSGSLPFEGGNAVAVIHAHAFDQPPPLTSVRPGLPAAVDPVLARALAKVPTIVMRRARISLRRSARLWACRRTRTSRRRGLVSLAPPREPAPLRRTGSLRGRTGILRGRTGI